MPEAERARHVGIALDELAEPVPCLGGGTRPSDRPRALGDRALPRTRRRAPTPSAGARGRRERAGRSASRRGSRRCRAVSASLGRLARRWRAPGGRAGSLPPRSMSAATSSSLRRRSPAAARASVFASSSGSGSSRSVSAGSGGVPSAAANPPSPAASCRAREPRLASEAAFRGSAGAPTTRRPSSGRRRRRAVSGASRSVPEQRSHHAVQARPPERRIEIVHLRGRLDLDVQRSGEQRRPRHELLVDRLRVARRGRRGCARRRR